MAQFDKNQSAVEYGESLLASKSKQQKKWSNRTQKIKDVNKVLGVLKIGDYFLQRNAQQKVKTFTSNLEDERANALNRLTNANKFRDNELAKLSSISSGVDFDDSAQWEEHGSVYNTLKKQESLAARSLLGYGSNEAIPSTERERFENIVNKSTDRAWLSLRNKYVKYSDYLGKDKVKVDRRYKRLLEDGTKQILSPKNTSSIRKLLAKFDIGTNINADLKEIEAGGRKLYVDKKVAKDFRNQQAATTRAMNLYKTGLSESAKRAAEENNVSIDLGLKHSSGNNITKHPTAYKEYDTYFLPVNPKTGSIERKFTIPLNHENPKLLDSGIDTADKRLANLESENGTIYKHSELYNAMTSDQKGEFYQAFNYFVGKSLDERKVEGVETTPNNGELIEAVYKAHQLVRVTSVERANLMGDRKFTFEIEKLSDYVKTQENSEEEINNLITRGKQVSSLIPSKPVILIQDDVEIVRHSNGTSQAVNEVYKNFTKELETILTNADRATSLTEWKNNMPVTIHSQLDDIYNDYNDMLLKQERLKDFSFLPKSDEQLRTQIEQKEQRREQRAITDLKKAIDPTQKITKANIKRALKLLGQEHLTTNDEIRQYLVENEHLQSSLLASTEGKKKIIKTRPIITERTENITTLLASHLKRFDINNEEQATSNLLDVFVPAVLEIESGGDYQAINKQGSGARGGFQFLGKSKKYPKGSAIAALNRIEKYLGTREWGAELREHGDASLLDPEQQTELFIGDMLEKKGSDKLMQLVFDGDIEGMIKAYEVLHHTAPDKATTKRARKIFATYF